MSSDLVGTLFPEILVSCIGFGFFISTVVNSNRETNILPPILFFIWILSALAGIIRYYADLAIDRLFEWRRSSSRLAASSTHNTSPDIRRASLTLVEDTGGDNTSIDHSTDPSAESLPDQQTITTRTGNLTKGAISRAVAALNTRNDKTDDDTNTYCTSHENENDDDTETPSPALAPDTTTSSNADLLYDYHNNSRGSSRIKCRQWADIVESFLKIPQTTLLLYHGPAVFLLTILSVRLFAIHNFQTRPIDLDFGPNNRSFSSITNGEDRIHILPVIQGFLSALLSFPAVSGSIARTFQLYCLQCSNDGDNHTAATTMKHKCTRRLIALLNLATAALSIYPAYNLLRRIIPNYYPEFASSSYSSDCFEWIIGYVLGVVGGMLVTSIVGRLLVVDLPLRYEGGLVAYMKSFEVSVRQRKNREEVKEELRLQQLKISTQQQQQQQQQQSIPEDAFIDNVPANRQLSLVTENSVITPPSAPPIIDTTSKREVKYAFGKLEEYSSTRTEIESCCSSWNAFLYGIYHVDSLAIINVLSILLLLLFTISALVSGAYLGITW
eukprot:CAMPEP_0198258774 /NCGR_PEP_ID=MMETSP1447-20131203/8101_1 /TAXON_ID=420782 /ORGANISM="Chaetoceros dichaeta, Strain CCMP1751" /LENGTH=554 /DNA_ID=CAMNT_0043945973 /DNA_START=266 /DNA_END=1927 /DNA_ORIENTATION=+